MKIDKAFINSVALQFVGDMDIWGMCDEKDTDMSQFLLLTLGYVQGVCDMAFRLNREMEVRDETD